MKYSNKIAARIVEMIEQDLHGISEICKILRISRQTFYDWKKNKPEFKEAVEEAFIRREEALVSNARIGLKQLLEGYTIKEEKIIYMIHPVTGEVVEKSRVVKKKHCPPCLRAIKMVLDQEEKRKEKDKTETQRPLIIEVPDEETKRQFMILKKNDFKTGGAHNPEIVAAVDRELDEERMIKLARMREDEKVIHSRKV